MSFIMEPNFVIKNMEDCMESLALILVQIVNSNVVTNKNGISSNFNDKSIASITIIPFFSVKNFPEHLLISFLECSLMLKAFSNLNALIRNQDAIDIYNCAEIKSTIFSIRSCFINFVEKKKLLGAQCLIELRNKIYIHEVKNMDLSINQTENPKSFLILCKRKEMLNFMISKNENGIKNEPQLPQELISKSLQKIMESEEHLSDEKLHLAHTKNPTSYFRRKIGQASQNTSDSRWKIQKITDLKNSEDGEQGAEVEWEAYNVIDTKMRSEFDRKCKTKRSFGKLPLSKRRSFRHAYSLSSHHVPGGKNGKLLQRTFSMQTVSKTDTNDSIYSNALSCSTAMDRQSSISKRIPEQQFFIMRHAERVDYSFGRGWLTNAFNSDGTYKRFDENMPDSLPNREHLDDFVEDCPITSNGEDVCASISHNLKSHYGIQFTHCFASPALRCIQTAVSILKGMDQEYMPIHVEPGLLEWLGWYHKNRPPKLFSVQQLHEIYPQVNTMYQPKLYYPKDFKPNETVQNYRDRSVKLMKQLLANLKHHDAKVLIVGHACSLSSLSEALLSRRQTGTALLTSFNHTSATESTTAPSSPTLLSTDYTFTADSSISTNKRKPSPRRTLLTRKLSTNNLWSSLQSLNLGVFGIGHGSSVTEFQRTILAVPFCGFCVVKSSSKNTSLRKWSHVKRL